MDRGKAIKAATSSTAANFIYEDIVHKYDVQENVLTDQGSHFAGRFMQETSNYGNDS